MDTIRAASDAGACSGGRWWLRCGDQCFDGDAEEWTVEAVKTFGECVFRWSRGGFDGAAAKTPRSAQVAGALAHDRSKFRWSRGEDAAEWAGAQAVVARWRRAPFASARPKRPIAFVLPMLGRCSIVFIKNGLDNSVLYRVERTADSCSSMMRVSRRTACAVSPMSCTATQSARADQPASDRARSRRVAGGAPG